MMCHWHGQRTRPAVADQLRRRHLWALIGAWWALGVAPARAALVPLDASRIEDLGALLEPVRQQFEVPALAGAIVTSDRLVGLGVVGTRVSGEDRPAQVTDQFHLGSCTKSMTATLLAMLVEEGKLTWQTTLGEVFGQLLDRGDPVWRSVTVEQVLSQRAGLPRNVRRRPPARGTSVLQQRRAIVVDAVSKPPDSPPGTQYTYSNLGFIIAGAVLEQLTGQSWEDVIQTRLFGPLGMASAGFGAAGAGAADTRSQPWPHKLVDGRVVAIEPSPQADNPPYLGPAGRVHVAIADWARYVALHLRGEQGRGDLLKYLSE